MATLQSSDSPLHRYFNSTQEQQMREEDFVAGRNVSSILISVVGAAMLAGMLVVAWITFFARWSNTLSANARSHSAARVSTALVAPSPRRYVASDTRDLSAPLEAGFLSRCFRTQLLGKSLRIV